MRRRPLLIVALTAIITFVSLQAFVGHRYYRPYAWHRWSHWRAPYDRYGPDSSYYRHHNRLDDGSWRTGASRDEIDSIERR